MNRTRHGSAVGLAVVVLLVLGLHGLAAAGPPTLESFAGVVGGVPANGVPVPGPCSTYGGPPALAFFIGGGALSVPTGGIATCGYSGDLTDVTATVGPLPAAQSLGFVSLGNPGQYSGDAQALANFGALGAMADGTVTGPAGNPLALANSGAAAFFSDTLTPSSPLVPNGSLGFIRYVFHFSGAASTPKPLLPFEPGTASAELSIQHNGGSPFPLVRVSSTRGSNGFIISRDGNTAGFVPGLGSIAGAGTFTSAIPVFGFPQDVAIIWGAPIDFRAGLLAYVGGDGVADFLTTSAQLVDVLLFDANHNPVTTFTLGSASGTTYAGCTFGIAPTAQGFGAAGGASSVSVTAPGGCAWSAASNDTFITVTSGANGSGDDAVAYTVAPNPGAARQGTLTIAGQTFTVTQDSGCVFSITPSSANYPSGGGTGGVTVSTAAGCAWTAMSNDTFITVTSAAGGTGGGTVGYSVDANTGPQRGGTVTIADQTFTVTQDSGCAYSITPTSAHVGAAGGSGNVLVATANGCPWTAVGNDDFLGVTSGDSGSGQGAVGYSVQANPTSGRHGSLTIAGQTFTVTQDGAVAVNTPAGSGVSVPLLGGGIRVLFSQVTQGGVTTAIPTDPCQPSDPCRALTQYRVLRGLNFGVSTSATFTGPVTLTFDLTKVPPSPITPPSPIVPPDPILPPNPITPPNPVTPPSPVTPPNPITPQFFATLRVLHGEAGTLTDRTVLIPGDPCRPNDAAQTICATVTSLSPFALVQLAPYDVLASALGDMLAVRQQTTDRKQARELDAATEALIDALDASLWIDTFHPRSDDVFDDTRRAVGKLTSSLSDASVQRIVDQILGADRELARTAVADATAAGGRIRKLADATDDIGEGDTQVARTAYTGAIKRYKDAWQDAGESMRR